MEDQVIQGAKADSYRHVIPLNLRPGVRQATGDVPVAACDCDGHCDYTEVCVIGDVPVDVCGIWG